MDGVDWHRVRRHHIDAYTISRGRVPVPAGLSRSFEPSPKMATMSTSLVENAPRYLSPAEAAELFGVKRETIYRQLRRGAWPAVRVGGSVRIPEAELRATLEATRTGPSGKASA